MTDARTTPADAHTAQLPVSGDTDTFLSHAEWVRTLLGDGGFATLTTNTPDGYPYGSMAAYSLGADGAIWMCLSDMAEHTRNATLDARAGLFVTARVAGSTADPMDEPRAALIGELRLGEPTPSELAHHLRQHPSVDSYLHFPDFRWWRLTTTSTRFIGGFGSMSWIDGPAYATVEADPVVLHSRPAIDHMNADHAAANLEIARRIGGIDDATGATVHGIDRYGMTLYVETPSGERTARVAFPDAPLTSPDQIRAAVVALVRGVGAER